MIEGLCGLRSSGCSKDGPQSRSLKDSKRRALLFLSDHLQFSSGLDICDWDRTGDSLAFPIREISATAQLTPMSWHPSHPVQASRWFEWTTRPAAR